MMEDELRPRVLALDAAGLGCSTAVAAGETVLATERVAKLHGQAEALMPMVDAVMARAGVLPGQLEAIATTVGPGSFTGIRVALAAACGIAMATDARIIGVTGFEAVAARVGQPDCEIPSYLLVALESRREDLFIQFFDRLRSPLEAPVALMPAALDERSHALIGAAPLLIAGDAAQRAALALSGRHNTRIDGDSAPDAVGVWRAALRRLRVGEGCPVRPLYLRAPDVTLSKEPSGGLRDPDIYR